MSKAIEILMNRNYNLVNTHDNYILMHDETNNEDIIIFTTPDNLSITLIKAYIKIMHDSDIHHCIIIYQDKITPSAKKIIETTNLTIEVFTNTEMSINVFNHKYYFPHIKVDDATKNLLLTKYGTKIPVILKNDMIIRYLNYKKGDIIKIIRKDDYITYRMVK